MFQETDSTCNGPSVKSLCPMLNGLEFNLKTTEELIERFKRRTVTLKFINVTMRSLMIFL